MLSTKIRIAAAIATSLTVLALGPAGAPAAAPRTTATPAKGAAGWLAQQFGTHFVAYGSFDGGTTADAIYALAAAGVGKDKINAAVDYFAAHVNEYTSVSDTSGKPGPYDGAVGKTAVAAMVADADPTHFGGYNLLQALKDDQCTSVSHPTNSDYSIPECPAPGSARNSYSSIAESLAILAEARGAQRYGSTYAPDAAATSYFLSLQCANGGFTAGTSGGAHCVSDPDATGYAMMALQAQGDQPAALARAAHWLTSVRNADGSWTAQHVHNVDSTGLAAAALRAHGVNTDRSAAWLVSQQMTVGPTVGAGASRGALKYQGSFNATSSIKATADGILGMVAHGSLATLSDRSAAADVPVLALAAPTVDHRAVAGRALTVTGTGFSSGEAVHGELGSRPTGIGTARANRSGTVSLTFTVPSGFAGRHVLTLTGHRSELASSRVVNIVAAQQPSAAQQPPAAPPNRTSQPTLAATGLDGRQVTVDVALGAGLVVAGALLLVIGRRRHR